MRTVNIPSDLVSSFLKHAKANSDHGVMDTLGNIRLLTDTDLRRGRERMVTVRDKDDNGIQIDNLRHILHPFYGSAVILAGLFGEQEVSHSELLVSAQPYSKESKSLDTIITVVCDMMPE